MKREFKFRGKTVRTGQWIFGDLDTQTTESPRIRFNYPVDNCVYGFEVIPETVGQFTDLHDKNGNEIYEGDVLKNNLSDNPFGVVTWHKDGYFFIDCHFGQFPLSSNGYRPIGEMLELKLDNEKDVFFEVIGNIHENKVLLTQN